MMKFASQAVLTATRCWFIPPFAVTKIYPLFPPVNNRNCRAKFSSSD